ncbi:hypothetical protein [Halalkalibacter alkalisediminis]|uniref:Uncharacterized protein n=1 Tax=Halalkalibacter alkalisediminis TaxID=935616 RepID=A0ABV6NDZ0_9BACI|nr:hypothetical protein [Halalkalibacter alkalisediminis]
MDGDIVKENSEENDLQLSWLQNELQKRNFRINEIYYAVLAVNGNINIDTYKDHILSPIDQE